MDITDSKYFSLQITERFLMAMGRIMGNRQNGKITAEMFAGRVGMSASNINRMRKNPGQFFVTVEALGRLVEEYKISSYWLLTGYGDVYSNDELLSAYKSLEARVSEVEKAVNDVEKSIELMKKKKGS